jgi:hypothetical protein
MKMGARFMTNLPGVALIGHTMEVAQANGIREAPESPSGLSRSRLNQTYGHGATRVSGSLEAVHAPPTFVSCVGGGSVSLLAMRRVRLIALSCMLTAALILSAAAASARPGVVGCKAEPGKRIALTRHYRFVLLMGSAENMYMPRQVRANHLEQVK